MTLKSQWPQRKHRQDRLPLCNVEKGKPKWKQKKEIAEEMEELCSNNHLR